VSGFLLIAVIALALAIIVAYRAGARSARNVHAVVTPELRPPVVVDAPDDEARSVAVVESRNPSIDDSARDTLEPLPSAELAQLREFGDDRRRLLSDLADARAEIARYRQIVIDIESNAPPPLLDAPGTPDDLKMIVGIGPVIERMLYQLGIGTYRQIARWSERDIDDFDARLREFPGRIRRDGWVTQARALHVGKYGSPP
jgi:predicted flap endonuclease-1-like 5' DNA nuclease